MTESALHILVVDDDPLARMTAAQCVKQGGHTAELAAGGGEALEMLRCGSFDLVLLDLMMPDVDGLEVLRTIKSDPGLKGTPVIMVSGTDEAESISRCMEMGAAGHLPKPLDPIRMAAQIVTCVT